MINITTNIIISQSIEAELTTDIVNATKDQTELRIVFLLGLLNETVPGWDGESEWLTEPLPQTLQGETITINRRGKKIILRQLGDFVTISVANS